MTDVLYLAWRYLAYHKVKTIVLVLTVAIIVFLPVGLDIDKVRFGAVKQILARGGKQTGQSLIVHLEIARSDFGTNAATNAFGRLMQDSHRELSASTGCIL